MKRCYAFLGALFLCILFPAQGLARECADIASDAWAHGFEDTLISSNRSTCTVGDYTITPLNQASLMFDEPGQGTKTPNDWIDRGWDTPIYPGKVIAAGPAVSIQRYDANNDGSISNSEFATAISEIGATLTLLDIDTDVTLTADHTVPSTCDLRIIPPGKFTRSSGKTITINGDFKASLRQVFYGSGETAFGATASSVDSVQGKLVHPEWWGAARDGTTNDSAAIQAAIKALPGGIGGGVGSVADGQFYYGGVVQFSKGWYLASGLTITKPGVVLRGVGSGNTIIQRPNGDSQVMLSIGEGTYEYTRIEVRDMQWMGKRPDDTRPTQDTILIHRVSDSYMTDVDMNGAGTGYHSLRMTFGASWWFFDHCTIGSSDGNLSIEANCFFNTFMQCQFTGSVGTYAITLATKMNSFVGCKFQSNYGAHIRFTTGANGNTVTGCVMDYVLELGGISAHIQLEGDAQGNVITGNTFKEEHLPATTQYGFYAVGSSTNRNIITNNYIDVDQLSLETAFNGDFGNLSTIENNWSMLDSAGFNLASAATLTLPEQGHYFNLQGTTGITSITASRIGRLVTLRKDTGTLTITDGSNLTIEGDFAISPNDTITLRCIGANWNEVSRTIESSPTYTVTNVTPDRAFDADSTTTAELADALGTLLVDLRARGVVR